MTSIEIDKTTVTREAWLHAAIDTFRPRFVEYGHPLPDKIHVSVGFGTGIKGENSAILGATWATRASDDGINHVFVNPIVGDTAEVLRILLHELIHAALDCEGGHKGRFAEIGTRFGFEGSMVYTPVGMTLGAELMVIAAELGEYPHGALSGAVKVKTKTPVGTDGKALPPIHTGPKTQTNRHLLVRCPEHPEYKVRITRSVAALGLPFCPVNQCGTQLDWA